jgi:hypothetical protein
MEAGQTVVVGVGLGILWLMMVSVIGALWRIREG